LLSSRAFLRFANRPDQPTTGQKLGPSGNLVDIARFRTDSKPDG
jgi:hypothetical protein